MVKEQVDASSQMKSIAEMKAVEKCIKDHGVIPEKKCGRHLSA